jgi:hypothetical protein
VRPRRSTVAVNLKKPLLRVLEKSDAKHHAAASGTGLVALRNAQQCETAALGSSSAAASQARD